MFENHKRRITFSLIVNYSSLSIGVSRDPPVMHRTFCVMSIICVSSFCRINEFPISTIRVLLGTSGGTAVLGSLAHSISLYSIDDDKVVQNLPSAHNDAISCMEEMKDGSSHYLATGSWDATVKVRCSTQECFCFLA